MLVSKPSWFEALHLAQGLFFKTDTLKRTGWPFTFFLLCLLGLTVAGQETTELLHLYDTTPEALQVMSQSGHTLAVSVRDEHLHEVSSSVLNAESWLRRHVLAHFPAFQITTIVVGNTLNCENVKDQNLRRVLPCLKNIHHSLIRWGLERDIKVSAVFSPTCFDPPSIQPVIEFLHSTNSTFSINVPPNVSPLSDEILKLISSHGGLIEQLGSFHINKINVIVTHIQQSKPPKRKLSNISSMAINAFLVRPMPLPEISQPPLHSSVEFSVPTNIAKTPLPPQAHRVSPAPLSIPTGSPYPPFTFPLPSPPPTGVFPSTPAQSSFPGPASAPHGYSLPPCNPYPHPVTAPAPHTVVGVIQRLWCVAKPGVPAETLQEAMDYACGEDGANCDEIQPWGSCFYPDTVVAHASYAFNSYWQKTKRNGGTCSFGGIARLINSDPSFLHCRFVLR